LHEIDELARHRGPWKRLDLWKFAAADVAARLTKGNHAADVFHSFTTDHYGVYTTLAWIVIIETNF
jgi:hypothetical protein